MSDLSQKEQRQMVTIKALFAKSEKILIVQDQKGKWELPGGTIKFGESPEEALLRELKEELGMTDVKIGKIVDTWSVLVEADWAHYQFVGIVYECFSNQTEVTISEEHQNFIWASWDEIAKLETGEHYKNTIRKYFNVE